MINWVLIAFFYVLIGQNYIKQIIYIDFKSKWYARLPFTALQPSLMSIYSKSGEAITVLNVPHGYSMVSCQGSGGDGQIDVFFSTRKPQGLLQWKTFVKRSWSITQANCQTHIHACTDNSTQLVWRQLLRVSFLFEEPNFYQYRFGLLWEK